MEFLDAMSKAVNTSMNHYFSSNPDATVGEETPLLAAALLEHQRQKKAQIYHKDIVAKIKELEEEQKKEQKERPVPKDFEVSLEDLMLSTERRGTTAYVPVDTSYSTFLGQYGRKHVFYQEYASRADIMAKAEENLKKAKLRQEAKKEEEVRSPSPVMSEYMWGAEEESKEVIEERPVSPVLSEYAWGEEIDSKPTLPKFNPDDYKDIDWFHHPNSPLSCNKQRYNDATGKWEKVDKFNVVEKKKPARAVSPVRSEYAWGDEEEEDKLSEYAWGEEEKEEKASKNYQSFTFSSDHIEHPMVAVKEFISLPAFTTSQSEVGNDKKPIHIFMFNNLTMRQVEELRSRVAQVIGNYMDEVNEEKERMKIEMENKCEEEKKQKMEEEEKEKKEEEEIEEETQEETEEEDSDDDSDFESVNEDQVEESSDDNSDFESVAGEDEEEVEENVEEQNWGDFLRSIKDTKKYSASCSDIFKHFTEEARKKREMEEVLMAEAEEKEEVKEIIEDVVEKVEEIPNKETLQTVMDVMVNQIVEEEKNESAQKLKELIEKQELVCRTICIDEKMRLMDEILEMMAQDWFQKL